jgi:hypothetical protein
MATLVMFAPRVSTNCASPFLASPASVLLGVDNWVAHITQDLLEVPHLHLTLTIDDALRPFFQADPLLLKDLLKVASQAVQELLADLYPDVRVGLIYTLHTFGRDLGYKPHVHLVMTTGGLKGDAWTDIEGIPGNRLAAKWRYLLCKRLRQVRPHDEALQRVIDQTYQDHRGFQVHTDSFYPKGLEAARYIGRYLGHPPLATSHLTAYDDHQVTYWYVDTATDQRITVTCSALDFISRLIQHLPPKGLQVVRYAGLYARCIKRRCAHIAQAALEALRAQLPLFALKPLEQFFQSKTWRERIKASFGYDPLQCPRCDQTLELVEIWEPKRGPVWMKRWLETHRLRKAARQAMDQLRSALPRYQQLAFDFNSG